MNYSEELPLGLGMGLAMNSDAMEHFSGLSETEKEQIISKSRNAKSKTDMERIIASLSKEDRIM